MNATINVRFAAVTISGASVHNLLWLIAVVNTALVIGMLVYIGGTLCSLAVRPRVLTATPLLAGGDYI
jgi:hypothetical protein